ncbi:hypothetical protein NE237_032404 [Protea cynaroides]|uniref:Late embryogenesis abundant protein LEA-2 subgroup domain-containing protein n=1 Tax=Protea cynaroides TaxID=273540 RepID=A0A9Q0R3F7_9MAGN|nr:hypothetical protein NE237_032404 [Protea cynaroides]
MWLSLRPSKPSFSINYFYVPALNTTAATNTTNSTNTTIFIDFKIKNTNKDKRVYYDALNITLNFSSLSYSVGNAWVPAFRQGHKKTAVKRATVEQVKIPWKEAVRNVSLNMTVDFRVDLVTAVRYKILFWKTGRHKIRFQADKKVDKQGKSAASDHRDHRPCFSGLLAFFLVFLTVW